jgi:hypothetical protein
VAEPLAEEVADGLRAGAALDDDSPGPLLLARERGDRLVDEIAGDTLDMERMPDHPITGAALCEERSSREREATIVDDAGATQALQRVLALARREAVLGESTIEIELAPVAMAKDPKSSVDRIAAHDVQLSTGTGSSASTTTIASSACGPAGSSRAETTWSDGASAWI